MRWIGSLCVGVGVLVFVSWRELARPGFSVSAGANVARVSVAVTQGTNHVFYYGGKVHWMWNEVCKRFGWRQLANGVRLHSMTSEPADTFWVSCEHRGKALNPRFFVATEVTAEGRRRTHCTTGAFCDAARSVSVSHWGLTGGMKEHRGSVLYIKYGGQELARIAVE